MNFGLKRIEAPTMGEALEKVRAQLGSDALIVSTRKFRRGGVLGVGGQGVVEVYATDTSSRIANVERERSNRSRPVPDELQAGVAQAGAARKGSEKRAAGKGATVKGSAATDSTKAGTPKTSALGKLMGRGGKDGAERALDAHVENTREFLEGSAALRPGEEGYEALSAALGQIRQEIRELMERTENPVRFSQPFLTDCYELLVSREVDLRLAERMVQQIARLEVPDGVPEPARVRAMVRSQLTNVFLPPPQFDETKKPRLMVLVGPTGVGKTTTIAKLAARAKINDRQKVGLITLDTFRIAAVDQLDKYAHIIGLPLKVATDPGELQAAVRSFRAQGMELIFIDTAGRSPRDELKMAELREFLSVLPGAEVHLVASTTTHARTIESTANRFAPLGFHMLILTKVDESVSFGALAHSLVSIGRPVSFVTDGQNVPDDIMPCDAERLADLVLKTTAL